VIVETEGLTKDYGDLRALRGIRLGVEAGSVVGLLGPNGAGKTTLVEILEGLREPTAGRVSVLGLDPARQTRALAERLGVQLQSTALPQELSPLETLKLFGAFFARPLPPGPLLERLGLTARAKSRNRSLSGGEQKRLAIGMALVGDPELLILDEPTAGLDPVARREIHAEVRAQKAAGRTVLLSTHDIDEAEALCDRVILLRSGEIVADGTPFDLVARAGGRSTLWIAVEGELDPEPLRRAGAVGEGREGAYHRFTTPDPTAAVVAMGELLQGGRATLVDLRMKRPDLEDVYLDLMGEPA
jgi:ABC-2 type transport system ATP-binding protein